MIRIFISYIKFNPKTGKFYIGRTSGYLTGKADDFFRILSKRDKYHEKNDDGYLPADIDNVSERLCCNESLLSLATKPRFLKF